MTQKNSLLEYTRKEIFQNECIPLMAELVVVTDGVEAHSHQFMEFALISEGEGSHISMQGEQKVKPGNLFILRPGAWHSFKNCKHLKVYNVYFGLELLQKELGWVRQIPGLNYLIWQGPLTSPACGILQLELSNPILESCQDYLYRIEELTGMEPIQNKAALIGLLLLFLSEVSQEVSSKLDSTKTKGATAKVVPYMVLEGMQLLEAEIEYPWNLSELASRFHLNPSYFARLFKAHTGLSPMAYLARQRAERAAYLLVETIYSIGSIAREVGLPDQNHFARCFRLHFGMSATDYRSKYSY